MCVRERDRNTQGDRQIEIERKRDEAERKNKQIITVSCYSS